MIAARQASDPLDISVFDPHEAKFTVMVDDLRWWVEALAVARDRAEAEL